MSHFVFLLYVFMSYFVLCSLIWNAFLFCLDAKFSSSYILTSLSWKEQRQCKYFIENKALLLSCTTNTKIMLNFFIHTQGSKRSKDTLCFCCCCCCFVLLFVFSLCTAASHEKLIFVFESNLSWININFKMWM